LEDEVMICPGCGAKVVFRFEPSGGGFLDEVESWRIHDSTRCHAADPVRRAARELADELVSLTNGTLPVVLGRKLAALRAALEG
jgi:hypothetical protein